MCRMSWTSQLDSLRSLGASSLTKVSDTVSMSSRVWCRSVLPEGWCACRVWAMRDCRTLLVMPQILTAGDVECVSESQSPLPLPSCWLVSPYSSPPPPLHLMSVQRGGGRCGASISRSLRSPAHAPAHTVTNAAHGSHTASLISSSHACAACIHYRHVRVCMQRAHTLMWWILRRRYRYER